MRQDDPEYIKTFQILAAVKQQTLMQQKKNALQQTQQQQAPKAPEVTNGVNGMFRQYWKIS